ncbi:MAG: ATP-binding domain-containing protein [Mycobacteriaceae bacterium]|nr:ATP-binding domain-containing protein [Mycobacteriaceae bacterium]
MLLPSGTPSEELDREQAYLTMLYGHLDRMRTYAATRLSAVLLESDDSPQARSERESFSRHYSEDLAKYDAAENGLCFGRIDLDGDPDDASEGPERRYVGRLGILDEENDYEPLLLDWRAPLARPFYLATTASPEGVTRRRHIRTRSRRVTAVNDEYLDLEAAYEAGGATAEAGGVGGESALLVALNAARTGHMNDIVETIQAEQDAIIRAEHKGVLVVQGGPGTGKTAVALHRAAYLLYTYRQQLARSGVLIIGPNATFLDYISQVLPSLGETGVLLSTIGDLYPGVKAVRTDSLRAGELKGSLDMVEVLKSAVRDRQELPAEPVELRFDTYALTLDRKLVSKARGRARSSRRPHNIARPIFVSAVVDALADQFAAALSSGIDGGATLLNRDDLADIRAEMRADPAIQAEVSRYWPELTPQEVLSDLLSDAQRLAKATQALPPEDRAELLRTDGAGEFSDADAPLLDELAELLGVDDAAERERARRRRHAQITEAQEALDILAGSAAAEVEDVLDADEILMAYDLIDASQLADRQDYRVHQTTAERAAGDRTWTYGHVIIDEAQELSAMAWRMVMRRIPNRWITMVGDVAQTGDPAGAHSWRQVLEPYVAQRWKRAELSVNYRTPAEVMAVAARVLAEIDPDLSVPRSVRETGAHPWSRRVEPARLRAELAALIAADEGPGTAAVLAPQALMADLAELDSGSVRALTVHDAKGLEFDTVYLVEPAAIAAESPRGRNDLYVALTRATQRLAVLHTTDLPPALADLPTR